MASAPGPSEAPSPNAELMTHGAVKAYAASAVQQRRFEWVVVKGKYFRPCATPGHGPRFVVEKGERWLDLGANLGYFALTALSKKASFVACVEAEQANAADLQRNIDLNSFTDRARVIRAMVRAPGTAGLLRLSEKSTRHAAQDFYVTRPTEGLQEVHTTTVSELLDAEPYDAIKINIEGAEREVLLSTSATTWRGVRKMVVEYSLDVHRNKADFDALLAHLRNTGWQVHPEAVPSSWTGDWDTRSSRGNDARQIWAFR